jgi:hypothetical protein
MSQPTAYNRQYNFTNYQSLHPSDPLPAPQVDAELNAVKTNLDGLNANIAVIQRDDGQLANQIVTPDSLATSVLSMMASWTVRGAWVTATSYAQKDMVQNAGVVYVCFVAHTSGTFATDLAAGKWVILSINSNSPNFSGVPTTPTAALHTNTTQIASCAFAFAEIASAIATNISSAMAPVVVSATTYDGAKLLGNGTLSSIAAGFVDTGVFAQFTANTNNYVQTILQNKSNGATASAGYIVGNDAQTASTFFGEFGMNSSGFTGSNSFNLPYAVYLNATGGELVVGTTTNNAMRVVINNATTDTVVITSASMYLRSPTGQDASLQVQGSAGNAGYGLMYLYSGAGYGAVGTYNNNPLRLVANSITQGTVDTSGNLTMNGSVYALNPAASAYGTTQSIPTGTNTLLAYSNTSFDRKSNYNNTAGNYKFTVPVSGVYDINAECFVQATSGNNHSITIYKNGASLKGINSYLSTAGTPIFNMKIHCLAQLTAGDYIQVYVFQDSGASQTFTLSDFDVHMVST